MIEFDPFDIDQDDVFAAEWAYEDALHDFDELLEDLDLYGRSLRIVGINIGWQNLTGYLDLHSNCGDDIVKAILPKYQPARWTAEKFNDDRVKFQSYHHDSPMGETYFISRLAE